MATETRTTPVNQIVLLGASNLTRALATAVDTAQRICGGPSRVLVAAGRGRSYGIYSRVLFRGLPGITQCGLWEELTRGLRLPTFALLTDLGNDIAYEVPAQQISLWVRWCVERLAEHQARIIITTLPLQNLEHLTQGGYRLFRALFFPGRRLSLPQALRQGREITLALQHLALECGLTLVEPRREWYGLDPIHIRRRCLSSAYAEILQHWMASGPDERGVDKTGLGRWWRFLLLAPRYQRVCGFDRYREQPAGLLPDGSTVSLY